MPTYHIKDSGPGKPSKAEGLDRKAMETGLHNTKAENETAGSGRHRRQCTGGCIDDTPGQVGLSNVDAAVILTATESGPAGLDSMGGSEFRGKGNYKDRGY